MLRWVLVAPAGVLGCWGGILVVLMLYQGVESLCPPDQVISGACMAEWAPAAHDVVVALGAAIGAALTVALPALTAPRRRFAVAALAYGGGVAYAAPLLREAGGDGGVIFIAAASAGLAVLVGVYVKGLAP